MLLWNVIHTVHYTFGARAPLPLEQKKPGNCEDINRKLFEEYRGDTIEVDRLSSVNGRRDPFGTRLVGLYSRSCAPKRYRCVTSVLLSQCHLLLPTT